MKCLAVGVRRTGTCCQGRVAKSTRVRSVAVNYRLNRVTLFCICSCNNSLNEVIYHFLLTGNYCKRTDIKTHNQVSERNI